MSQNNTIRKSDKKFIRTQKAQIRAKFLDVKKQEELINNLYKKFVVQPKAAAVEGAVKEEPKKVAEVAKVVEKKEKAKPKKEKVAKKAS